MNKNNRLFLAVLLIAALFSAGCATTDDAAATAADVQDPAEAQALIVGTWVENPNRDGNIETGTWNADGSFFAEVTTKKGELVEIDGGTYCFENGYLKLTIDKLGGEWTGGKLEPFGSTVIMYYSYYVTEDTLHLERVKRVIDEQSETFRPTLKDDYTRE